MVCYMVVVWYNVNVIHDGDVVQCTTGTWCGIPRYMVWYMMYAGTCIAGKAKEAPSCWWRKWLYTQIGALTPTYFAADAHDDDDDDDGDDDDGDDDGDDGNIGWMGLSDQLYLH